jgi:hypothetical protein
MAVPRECGEEVCHRHGPAGIVENSDVSTFGEALAHLMDLVARGPCGFVVVAQVGFVVLEGAGC